MSTDDEVSRQQRLRRLHELHHALERIWQDGDGDEWAQLPSGLFAYAADRRCRDPEDIDDPGVARFTAADIESLYKSLRRSRKRIFFLIEERP